MKRRELQQHRRRPLTVAGAAGGVRYGSALACAAAIVRSDGPMGLLKGWCARALHLACAMQSWGPHCNMPVFGSGVVTARADYARCERELHRQVVQQHDPGTKLV